MRGRGEVVAGVFGLGAEEALPLRSEGGLQLLGKLRDHYALRELLWLAYPVLVLPQGIALFSLLRREAPALVWCLIFWSVGLTLGIGVDLFTVGLAHGLGTLRHRPRVRSVSRRAAKGGASESFVAQLLERL